VPILSSFDLQLTDSHMGCEVVLSGRNLAMFGMKVLHPSSARRKQQAECSVFCLLGLIFSPEGEGSKLLKRIGKFIPDSTASHPRRLHSLQ
jgi:hypothetical protein